MDIIKFFYTNLFKSGTITVTSEHVNFPKENLQHRDFNKMWHSNHDAGSGWGNFKIVAGVNDKIDFEETAAAELTATLTPGEYNADELCAEKKTQLEVAGASTYTITYSDTTNKFTYASNRGGGGGTFKILWLTGTNAATSVGITAGFDVTADDADAASHEADDLRIHSEERAVADLASIQDIYAMIIRGHNFQSTATVEAIFSADNWATIAEAIAFTVQDDILVLEWDTPKQYRYIGYRIKDVDNPSRYVAFGVPYGGGQFQPETNFMGEAGEDNQDLSNVQSSEDGQESSIQLGHFDIPTYAFHVKGLTEKGYFDTLFDAVGKSKAFFYCEDPDLPLTTTKYVAINSFSWSGRRDVGLYTYSMQFREQR